MGFAFKASRFTVTYKKGRKGKERGGCKRQASQSQSSIDTEGIQNCNRHFWNNLEDTDLEDYYEREATQTLELGKSLRIQFSNDEIVPLLVDMDKSDRAKFERMQSKRNCARMS